MSSKYDLRASTAIVVTVLASSVFTFCSRSEGGHRTIKCGRFPNEEPAVCELRKDGEVVVSPRSLSDIEFGPEGVGCVVVESRGLYFVNRQGKTAPALAFDNGPDYFVEGLARTLKNEKVGFVNKRLEEIVTPVWDFAFPFQDGVAVVCTGCAPAPVSAGSEHTRMIGGKWGYIDKRGTVVVPVQYDINALPPVEFAAKKAVP